MGIMVTIERLEGEWVVRGNISGVPHIGTSYIERKNGSTGLFAALPPPRLFNF